jgi:hypothetical protein
VKLQRNALSVLEAPTALAAAGVPPIMSPSCCCLPQLWHGLLQLEPLLQHPALHRKVSLSLSYSILFTTLM